MNFGKKSHDAKFLYKQKFRSQKSSAKDYEIENLEKTFSHKNSGRKVKKGKKKVEDKK